MAGPVVDILMYHSISDAPGPTSISPGVFRRQMEALGRSGLPVISLDDLVSSREGIAELPCRSVIITFDDALSDFAECAWPVLEPLGFRPIIYVPTGFVGRAERWRGSVRPPRPLMDWDTIRALADAGVHFGSHSVSHSDLIALNETALDGELRRSREALEDRLGAPVRHFAPPYGRANQAVRRRIAEHYQSSVGTTLGHATTRSDRYDLPRLEMFYFTTERRWSDQLAGRGRAYLAARSVLRGLRDRLQRPWDRVKP